MFGGLPQDMIPEDRIPTQENEDMEISVKKDDKKQAEPKKKSTGFFGAVKNMFKSNTKAEPKQDKKTEPPPKQNSMSKSFVAVSPIYENDLNDERYKELSSPTDYVIRPKNKHESNGALSARYRDYPPTSSPGIEETYNQKQRLSASYISSSNGRYKDQ